MPVTYCVFVHECGELLLIVIWITLYLAWRFDTKIEGFSLLRGIRLDLVNIKSLISKPHLSEMCGISQIRTADIGCGLSGCMIVWLKMRRGVGRKVNEPEPGFDNNRVMSDCSWEVAGVDRVWKLTC
jgi:hypothetical protein